MENAPVKSLINSKEQLSDILKKLLCTNSQIEMDVKEFFDCIRTSNSSSKKNLTFTNCDFYLSNEGISILENAAHIGLPVPQKLKEILEQLHNRTEDK